MRKTLFSLIAAGLALGACADLGPESLRLQQLEAARARWLSARPERYAFTLEHVCDCAPEERGPVRVEVEGATVVSRTYASGEAVDTGLTDIFPSVDGLFRLLEDAIRADAWEVRVEYDLDTGVPLELRIDYESLDFGEEIAYAVVVAPAPVAATLASVPGV